MCELATTISGKSRKFAEILNKTGPDDMVHSKIGSLQVSRRVAFVDPSITNVGKRGVGLQQRSLIVPRQPGEVIMCSDLSQGDMRIMAALSQDPEYMKLFVGDRDAHAEVAVALLGTRELQELAAEVGALEALMQLNMMYLRDQAKAIGHGVNYGMGIDSTIANTGLPREIVERYFRMRAQTYRVLNRWTDQARKEAESGKILDNGFGRSMNCDPLQAHTQGPALYGQSGTREIIMHGVRQMPLWVRQMLLMVVHDEVVLSVPRARYEEIAMIVQESLRVTWNNVFFDCDVSNPGENWGECYDKEKGKAWQKHYKEYQENLAMAA
jgi:DNA polymerase-1